MATKQGVTNNSFDNEQEDVEDQSIKQPVTSNEDIHVEVENKETNTDLKVQALKQKGSSREAINIAITSNEFSISGTSGPKDLQDQPVKQSVSSRKVNKQEGTSNDSRISSTNDNPEGDDLEDQHSATSSDAAMDSGVTIDYHFRRRFCLFKGLGIYLGEKNNDGTYTFTIGKLIAAYIVWYIIPVGVFVAAEIRHYFQVTGKPELSDIFGSEVFILACLFLPLFCCYSLCAITYALKKHMNNIPSYLNLSKEKGQYNSDNTRDEKCWSCCTKFAKILGGSTSSIMFLQTSIMDLVNSTEGIKEKLLKEMPVFVVDVILQILPLLTTIFAVSFLDFYTELHRDIKVRLLNLCADWSSVALNDLSSQIEKVQRTFQHLYTGFLQYALTVNTITTTFFASITIYRLTIGSYEMIYLVPAIIGVVHILLIAKYSRDLMFEAKELTRRVGDEARNHQGNNEEKYRKLKSIEAQMNKYPPVVKAYCGVPFGYGIIPIIGVFLLVSTGLLDFLDDFQEEIQEELDDFQEKIQLNVNNTIYSKFN